MVVKEVIHSIRTTFDNFFHDMERHWLITLAGCALIGGAVFGWYTHRYYRIKEERVAHMVLADCLNQYQQAERGKAQWADVIAMCQSGYEKYSSTKIAPYILAVEVDALLAQHKQQEAYQRLDAVVQKMSSSSPLYNLYKTKRALLQLDMDEPLRSQGLQELQALADDASNTYNDQAQYYVGLYYKSQGQLDKARQAWQPLIALNEKYTTLQSRSPWAALAQEKMAGLA